MQKIPLIAIVGRTNVGKSTLFNALAGRPVAIVQDTPGVTRDRHYTLVKRFSSPFTLIDTGGFAGEQEISLSDSVRMQTEIAIEESDLVICLFDGVGGPHPLDEDVVQKLRNSNKPVMWVINKCESTKVAEVAGEFYALGIDELMLVSAAHRVGINELAKRIDEKLKSFKLVAEAEEIAVSPNAIRVAVVGKPSVGKSSIINRILGEERLIASPIPGTTRDSIDISLTRDKQEFIIVDTAGLRKKARVEDLTVERFSNLRSLRALARCDIAVLVLDATQGMPTDQEAKIASLIHERGRGVLIVVNKWDAVEKDHKTVKNFTDGIYAVLPFMHYAPILYVSSKTGQRCPHILEKAKQIYDSSKCRIKTSDLNRVLDFAVSRKMPPVYRGEPVKIYFATQIGVSPPKIVLFVNYPKRLPSSYQRYLKNMLRKEFPFEGSEIRFHVRKRTEKVARKGGDYQEETDSDIKEESFDEQVDDIT